MSSDLLLEIWTDGACKFNPGPGGWGVYMVYGRHTRELCCGALQTTNNQMELTAVIEALGAIKRPCPVRLHLDSSYVKDGITKWIHGWKKRGWKKADKSPVLNQDLWEALDAQLSRHQVTFVWVKGHADNPYNNRCDELATGQIRAHKDK